jgi:hypothetical protein
MSFYLAICHSERSEESGSFTLFGMTVQVVPQIPGFPSKGKYGLLAVQSVSAEDLGKSAGQ